MEIKLGAKVICRDGEEAGRVQRLVADAKGKNVFNVVVGGGDLDHDVVASVGEIQETTDDSLRLRLTLQEVTRLPEYVETEYVVAPGDWHSGACSRTGEVVVPVLKTTGGEFDGQLIRVNTPVRCLDAIAGKVEEIRLHPVTGELVSFVVGNAGSPAVDKAIVPREWVRSVADGDVVVNCTLLQLQDELLVPRARAQQQANTSRRSIGSIGMDLR